MNAFVSCSLRIEDKKFVDYICRILKAHKINTFGTVGKFSAAPENPVVTMQKNIDSADIVVICATPRYLQKDVKSGKESKGISEMIHVEAGMAMAKNKPLIVFVEEGTDVGSAIPSVTQYITLNGQKDDFIEKKNLIYSLLNSAYCHVQSFKDKKTQDKIGTILVAGLAIYGGVKLVEFIFGGKK